MAHRVRLRREHFEAKARSLGLDSNTSQARAIGVHHSIHSRALHNKRELNSAYVIGVLMLVGDDNLREQVKALFDVEEPVAC